MYSQWLVKTATPINPVVESVTKAVKRLQTMFNVFPILFFMILKNEKKRYMGAIFSEPNCINCNVRLCVQAQEQRRRM